MSSPSSSWLTAAVNQRYIQLYQYSEFANVKFDGEGTGEGRFSKVASADWQFTDRKVALKKLKKYDLKKFIIEVKLHNSSHPSEYVIRFLGLTQQIRDGPYLMVLEYANLDNLRNFLRKGRVSWIVRLKLSLDIAKGLRYLHLRNIAHRDLHSNNIMINRVHEQCPEYVAKITDFGGAKLMTDNDEIEDFSGVLGQIAFTDPKHLNNQKKYKKDLRSDIYSLGVIFWEITSRRTPFGTYSPEIRGYYRETCLALEIIAGKREIPARYSLPKYNELYQKCWLGEPSARLPIQQIIADLKDIDVDTADVLAQAPEESEK